MESPTPMMWPPGLTLQQNKLTGTVFHKSQFIVVEEHDCGHMIPHITLPPLNTNLPLIILFSKRKVMFTASTVRANGAQIGATEACGLVSFPMLCCASPTNIPNCFPAFNSLHTVSVGLSIGDIIAGFIAIVADMLGDALARRWGLKLGGLDGLAAKLLDVCTLREWALKQALGLLSGCARIALTQEGKLKIDVGSGYARARAWQEFTREGRTTLGGFRLNAANEQLGYAYISNPRGTTSHQVTGAVATPVGSVSVQRTHTSGRAGKPAEEKTQITATGGLVDAHADGPGDTAAISVQNTTTAQADGHSRSTTVGYAGGSSAAGSWGMPL
jgi:hypothetical protein